MSGGGGNSGPSQQTVTQTNLPEYARPYFERLMGRAEAVSNQPYQLYGGPRIADFNADQESAFDIGRNLQGSYQPGMTTSQGLTTLAAANSPSEYTAGTHTPGTITDPGVFDSAAAQQYMNPYLDTVLNNQLSRLNTRFGEQRLDRNARAARSGVFGGYRQGVEEAIAERDYNQQLNETEGNALFQAYQDAQGQFNRDRDARLGSERFNIETGLNAFNANEGAAQAGERLRQSGLAGLLSASNQLFSQSQGLMDADMRAMEALRSIGLQQQQQDQASLDLAHQDFVDQNNYDLNQLNFLNSILRGVPITSSTTVSQYENPNPYSQLLGLGMNGLAIANALGTQGGGG